MKTRIKIFNKESASSLEKEVNFFLEECKKNNYEVTDIKYNTWSNLNSSNYSAMVIYTEF